MITANEGLCCCFPHTVTALTSEGLGLICLCKWQQIVTPSSDLVRVVVWAPSIPLHHYFKKLKILLLLLAKRTLTTMEPLYEKNTKNPNWGLILKSVDWEPAMIREADKEDSCQMRIWPIIFILQVKIQRHEDLQWLPQVMRVCNRTENTES